MSARLFPIGITLLTLSLTFACGDGKDGEAGPMGAPGTQGPAGQAGQDGTSGDPGTDGKDGDPGPGTIFAGPGLVLTLESASITGTTATVDFTITDEDGSPLDRDGLRTAGSVSGSFILAVLEEDDEGAGVGYRAYTTREQTSPITNETAIQAGTDSGGTFTLRELGAYRYTFATPVMVENPDFTHTVAVYSTRTFEDVRYVANAELNFRPDGAPVTTTRELATDATCANCHDDLSAHGGSRKDLLLCQACHTEDTIDPDTGNTVDWKVMIHKIHMGAALPSVQAGEPYTIIGFRQSVHDYSDVHFPQLIEQCEVCHADGADVDRYKIAPSATTCIACHDRTSFVDPPPTGFVLHAGGAQPEGAPCNVCHPATGSLAGVVESHLSELLDPANPTVAFELLEVTNSAPGQQPTVRFRVTVDGAGRDIATAPLDTFRATFAGPNTDFAEQWQTNIEVADLTAIDATAGEFSWTAPITAAIPATAEGSYTVGLEGNLRPDAQRFSGFSPTMPFAVTDAMAVPRRVVTTSEKCNACHGDLAEHGDQRKNPGEYCAMCHNAGEVNDGRFARFEDADVYVPTTDFKRMVHKIHAGENLSQPYVLGGFPFPNAANPAGNPIDFGHTLYPSSLSDCSMCHEDGTQQLPISLDVLPSVEQIMTCTEDPAADADDYCNDPFWVVAETVLLQPEKSVCTSCHDSPATAAHADIMTTPDGRESCATCHGPGSGYDVDIVHGR